MIRLAVRVDADAAGVVLAELLELSPAGVEERELEGGAREYVIYGAPGELPELPDLEAAAGEHLVQISTEEIPDDWSERWKAWHRPVDVSWRLRRMRVRPPWEAPLGDPDLIELVVDPGQAFGTGAHHTTRLCLELLLGLEPRGAFADWGTGTGVLAIAAARLGYAPVVGVDHDPLSVEAAAENAQANGVELEVGRLDLRRQTPPHAPTVCANLLRPLLLEVARNMQLAPERLIASGLLREEADEVAAAFARRAAFGGLTAARRLERLLPRHAAKVTLVSDVNFMLYTPLLPGAAGGTLEPRHVVVSLRDELSSTELRLGHVLSADPERRTVRIRNLDGGEYEEPYDELLVGLGSTSRTLPVPGLAEHALGFKTIAEAIALRNRLLQCMERAEACADERLRSELLTFVFVGAGYAGLEGIAELQDFAHDVLDHYPRCREHGMRFVLVEARGRVMPEISANLAEFAEQELRKRGMEIRTNTTLEEVTATTARLSDGEVVPARTVCWTAGVRPVREVAELGLPLGPGGRIPTDACLRVPGVEHVWALGDAAAVPDPARPGSPCPPTCQHALRQGRLAALNIARALKGREPEPFTYKTLGVFVDMGRYEAVAETMGVRWRGFPAWFLARSYHMAMMPGVRRKLRLIADWTVALLFGRDATELGQLGHPPRLDVAASAEPKPFEARRDEVVGGPGAALDDRARAQT